MDKCPGLIGGTNDPSTSCNIPSAVDEVVLGEMAALPGHNPVTPWGTNLPAPSQAPGTSPAPVPTPSAPVAPAINPPALNTDVAVPTTPAAEGPGSEPTSTTTEFESTVTIHTTSYVYVWPDPTDAPSSTGAAADSGDVTVYNTYTIVPIPANADATSADAAPTPAPPPSNGGSPVSGWGYAGCFSDDLNNRALTGVTFANIGNHEVTNTKCINYCGAKGFSIAGTEFGGQCFCGNELSSTSSKLDESSCNMPCEGDGTQTCGGDLALSVFKAGGMKKRLSRHLARHLRHSNH
jgi:WSC domain